MKKKKNKVLEVLWVIVTIVLLLILLINVCIMLQTKLNPTKVPSILGYKPFIVLSGSMETQINTGDLVIVKETDPNTLKIGDIIAFRNDDNTVTTHRIVSIVEKNERCFTTKGDNNNVEDKDLVCASSVEGKYQMKIAKFGNVLLFIQKPLGFTILMLSIVIICGLIYLGSTHGFSKLTVSNEELKEFEEYKRNKSQKK